MTIAAPTSGSKAIALAACDWGTTNLRLWAVAEDGSVAGFTESDAGMNSLSCADFPTVFEALARKLGVGPQCPAIICGMAGSRQGWHEAPYQALPCVLNDLASAAVRVPGTGRDIRILPGIARRDAVSPDVMRSEETQLLGLARDYGQADGGLVCMPGTHTKWVHLDGPMVVDFITAMTGEMHALLSRQSILRHAVEDRKADPASAAFAQAVQTALSDPASVLSRLFGVRAGRLLNGLSAQDAADGLSGLLIGTDIAAACARTGVSTGAVTLIGGHGSGAASGYRTALQLAGFTVVERDAHAASLQGLIRAAATIWPERVRQPTFEDLPA